MPTAVIDIDRIDTTTTAVPGVRSHLVTGRHTDGTLGAFQVHTVNDFAASLCLRAKELEKPIACVWKDGRYGKQLVTVAIVGESVSGESEAPDPPTSVLKASLARINRVVHG